MTITVTSITQEVSGLSRLMGRRSDSPHEDMEAHHKHLGSLHGAPIVVASFQGQGCWERHPMGEELVQIVDGSAEVTLITDSGPETVTVDTGAMFVVPAGIWHRFTAPHGVTLLVATPQPSDHCYEEDPRE
jgi:mannose-6-phosphate isomerase-like protein (cupin superfamily)